MTDRLTDATQPEPDAPELNAAEATLENLETLPTHRHDTYPAYRPSGIEWLGEVPEHWDVKRLKRSILSLKGGVWGDEPEDENTGTICVRVADFDRKKLRVRIADPTRRNIPVNELRGRLLRKGDLLLEKSGGGEKQLVGSVMVFDHDAEAVTSNFVARMIPAPEYDSRYLVYLHSFLYSSRINFRSIKQTTGIQNLDTEAYLSERVAFPPLEEQRKIARFLDERTAKIDDLIRAKHDLLALLKEKRQAVITHAVTKGLDPAAKTTPSGIEWLGDVPENWDVSPLYARYDSVLGKMLDEKRMSGDALIPYLRNVDVQWDRVNTTDLPEMDIASSEYERFTVREGDLLVCEGGEVGRCAIWKNQLALCGFQKAIHRVRAKSLRDIPRFLFYVLKCAASYGAFVAGSNPNTIPHLTGEKLRRHRFPMPPLDEQQKIAHFLDEEMTKMDKLEAVVNEAVALLRSLRTSLISAAVTGKIDVRDYAG